MSSLKIQPKLPREQSRRINLRTVLAQREISLAGVLIGLVILFSVLSSRFATADNFAQIATDMAIVVVVAVGEALVLFTRNIDVSVGSMVGLTAFFASNFAAGHPALPLIATIGVTCVLGLILGSINGLLVAALKVPSIMVTLGTLYVFRGVGSALAGAQQVTAQNLPANYDKIASWSIWGVPGIFLYAVVIAGAAYLFTRHTFTGRSMLAIGSDPASADRMGIASRRLIFAAYAVSGMLCGFAGVLWGARYGTVDSSVATGFEIVVLAAVIVGGVSITGGNGTIPGVFLGAAILSVIAIGLALVDVSAFWLQAIQGLVIIVAVVFDLVLRRRLDKRGATA